MELTAVRLRHLINYDPVSGRFTWLTRDGCDRLTKSWNARYAGTRAGSIDRQKGYVFVTVEYEHFSAARLAWLYMTGSWPTEMIDHINGIRSDDRFCNLREATAAQNNTNRRGFGRSGLKGAYHYPEHGCHKWKSWIRAQGKTHQLGSFETAEAAHEAYRQAAIRLHGEFARIS